MVSTVKGRSSKGYTKSKLQSERFEYKPVHPQYDCCEEHGLDTDQGEVSGSC